MKKSGGGETRSLRQRVRKTKLKNSSRRWLERHLNDPYVHRSRAEGYRSRAAFKLIEIDDRYHLLRPGARVIDLGAAPGGWCQVAAARVKSSDEAPLVVGIDYLEMDTIPGVDLLRMDFLDPAAPEKLMATLGAAPDLVISDMAPNMTGVDTVDQARQQLIAYAATDCATVSALAPA